MSVRADDYDAESGLVKVEELREHGAEKTDPAGNDDDAPTSPPQAPVPADAGKSAALTTAGAGQVALEPAALAAITALTDALDKRDYTTGQRRRMAADGRAMPGGGYPIPNVAALRDAIRSIGRAKDPAAARALDRGDLIPDGWTGPDDGSGGKAASAEVMAHDPAVLQQIRDGLLTLLIQECYEAMTGEREEADLACLIDTLGMFLAWWDHEAYEGEAPAPADVKAAKAAKAADPDHLKETGVPDTTITPTTDTPADPAVSAETKAASVDPAQAAVAPAAPAAVKAPETPALAAGDSTKIAAADTVKAAVEQAMTTVLDEVRALRTENGALVARLEQVEKAAAPGGPTPLPPPPPAGPSPQVAELKVEAARLRALSKGVSDHGVAAEYERRAGDVETRIRDLTA
jgi:flagellin-like hook-associated protein FlgL